MAIFDIDADIVLDSIADALESAGKQVSEEQFDKIVEAIDDAMPGVIEVLVYGMQEYWQIEAQKTSRWGRQYAEAIKAKVDDKGEGEIYLDETTIAKGTKITNFVFAMMVEQGVKTWSIKDALLASERAKTSHEGIKYIIIPFPVAVPRTANQGKMTAKFGQREMTKAMYDIVHAGGKLKSGSLNVRGKDMDVSGLSRWTSRKYHQQYGIFRCVSEKSRGWQYPNIEREPVFPAVLEEVNHRIQEMLHEFCKAIVKEYTAL